MLKYSYYVHVFCTILCLEIAFISLFLSISSSPLPPPPPPPPPPPHSWCSHPRLADMVRSEATPPVLQIPRQLIELPERYSDLVKEASTFQCPQRSDGREYSDDGQAAMLCLVCGEMLCTNSYCCQKVVEVEGEERSEEDKLRIGGFTQHAQRLAVHDTCIPNFQV